MEAETPARPLDHDAAVDGAGLEMEGTARPGARALVDHAHPADRDLVARVAGLLLDRERQLRPGRFGGSGLEQQQAEGEGFHRRSPSRCEKAPGGAGRGPADEDVPFYARGGDLTVGKG